MTKREIFLACSTVVLNGGSQLLLRAAALRGASVEAPLTLVLSPLFLLALAGYAFSVLTWLAVLKTVPLTVAAPFVAMVYVLVPLAARFAFDDELTGRMIGGMILVVTGVIVVAAR